MENSLTARPPRAGARAPTLAPQAAGGRVRAEAGAKVNLASWSWSKPARRRGAQRAAQPGARTGERRGALGSPGSPEPRGGGPPSPGRPVHVAALGAGRPHHGHRSPLLSSSSCRAGCVPIPTPRARGAGGKRLPSRGGAGRAGPRRARGCGAGARGVRVRLRFSPGRSRRRPAPPPRRVNELDSRDPGGGRPAPPFAPALSPTHTAPQIPGFR
uniref:uncharacterized protein LOC117708190 n=1 Tax=Arvicanthis niloticus TaxID=61156 RepID=UPI00402BB07E